MQVVDSKDRSWDLEINVGHAMKFLDRVDLDLVEGDVTKIITRVLQEATTRIKMIWIMVEPQATAKNIDEDMFWDGVNGETLKKMSDALQESLVNFIVAQRPETASVLQATISKYGLLLKRQVEMQVSMLDSPLLNNKLESLEKDLQKEMERQLGSLSIDLLEQQAGK